MRSMSCHLLAISSALALLTGCGSTYSLKEFTPASNRTSAALVDIKQRAIFTGQSTKANAPMIVCAEPSPDAMSSLASEFAADAKLKEALTATLAFSQQESSAFVGLRTQTIQLLRDGMYRLCEGYLSGALSQADFAWLSRRYQRNMVALLTIEQLTRVAQVPTMALLAQGSASAARSTAAVRAEIEGIDMAIAALDKQKAALDAAKVEADKLPDGDAKKAKLKAIGDQQAAVDTQLGTEKAVREALLERLKSPQGVTVAGSTSAVLVADAADDRTTIGATVATEIGKLTMEVLNQDDLGTMCFQVMEGTRTMSDMSMQDKCRSLLEQRVKRDEGAVRVQEAVQRALLRLGDKDPELLVQAVAQKGKGGAVIAGVDTGPVAARAHPPTLLGEPLHVLQGKTLLAIDPKTLDRLLDMATPKQ